MQTLKVSWTERSRKLDKIGENARQNASLTDQNADDAVMTVFQSVLDQLVQSYATIIDEEGLEKCG